MVRLVPCLHAAPARGSNPRGESDSPFFCRVTAIFLPREPGLTRLFCPTKRVGFDPGAGAATAILCPCKQKAESAPAIGGSTSGKERASFMNCPRGVLWGNTYMRLASLNCMYTSYIYMHTSYIYIHVHLLWLVFVRITLILQLKL